MKVQICETVSVDVETTVNVDINDVLMEFSRRIESAEMNGDLPYRSTFLPLVDFATQMMAKIPEQGISKCTNEQRAIVAKRLYEEGTRWNSFVPAENLP